MYFVGKILTCFACDFFVEPRFCFIGVSGDINVSKKIEFPVIYPGLTNADDEVDRSQDGEGYLSILAGKNGTYIFNVGNSDKKRARTFKLEVKVSNDREDFEGGEDVEQ